MGIYLGQLPPAEIARLKAELAETLIAHFCYPRFFDNRTSELRMRPVDRAKRQEVWLFLSSVDFTSWGRVDLMSPDFQHQIERLFIQFVQRNRAFFGDQGRKRMSDVRMLINSSATSVAQGLRNHLTGQRQGGQPFGSPRPAISWSHSVIVGAVEPGWEQIASTTMLLQQQLQELRGEIKAGVAPAGDINGMATRRSVSQPLSQRPQIAASSNGSAGTIEHDEIVTMETPAQIVPTSTSVPSSRRPAAMSPGTPGAPMRRLDQPAAMPQKATEAPFVAPPLPAAERTNGTLPPPPMAKSGQLPPLGPTMRNGSAPPTAKSGPLTSAPPRSGPLAGRVSGPLPASETMQPAAPPASAAPMPAVQPASVSSMPTAPPVQSRGTAQPAQSVSSAVAASPREANMMAVGEDDIAIFEQMRLQLLVWLRVEAIRAGLDVSGQTPAQLLDMLRQQARFDETRLQVVSTLLNLSNQIIKTGVVSLLDYKQALMFHLMHTRH